MMIRNRIVFALIVSMALHAQPQTRPIKRPPNNQLALEGPDLPTGRIDAPVTIVGMTSQLVFHASPLSSKGLLSQQVEDALKALDKANGTATFLKIRAFVSGTGDLRRVQGIVADHFSAKKLPLPIVTTIQVGAMPQENAQVVIESISEEKKPVNENGLSFFAGREAESGAAAVQALQSAMASARATPLRATCIADSLAEAEAARDALQKLMPKAASVSFQATRYQRGSHATCEGVGQGGPVRNTKLVFTSVQLAAGDQQPDLHAAFDRVDRAVESFGISRADAVQLELYSVNSTIAGRADTIAGATPHTSMWIEALTSLDATLAVEAIIPTK